VRRLYNAKGKAIKSYQILGENHGRYHYSEGKEMTLINGRMYYWRFKGEKVYRYGYATPVRGGLWRMGAFNGDTKGGRVIDPDEIEGRMI
jgi:hypothetical protein